jgi:hypothetical protein
MLGRVVVLLHMRSKIDCIHLDNMSYDGLWTWILGGCSVCETEMELRIHMWYRESSVGTY